MITLLFVAALPNSMLFAAMAQRLSCSLEVHFTCREVAPISYCGLHTPLAITTPIHTGPQWVGAV